MGQTAPKKDPTPTSASNDPKSGSDLKAANRQITERQSRELVIALCGPIGSGIHNVSTQLEKTLRDEGYEVHIIRVSKQIEQLYEKVIQNPPIDSSSKYKRFTSLMDAGDKLRNTYENTICANLAMREIALIRDKNATRKGGEPSLAQNKLAGLNKTAYIIDQLKHPEEAIKLKEIYRNIFYLVGILCDEQRRETSLTADGIDKTDAHNLIMRDKKDNHSHGQQLEKTLYNADFFINNSDPNSSSVAALFERFLKLIHGNRGVTPTQQEIGMYAAYASSMQSGCLSRQVGAAILDHHGGLLATGRNDVPKFGGGLYSEDDHMSPISKDYRCLHRDQRCHNDMHKINLKDKIQEILDLHIKDQENSKNIAEEIFQKTPIKSLIEYSRAIHAEMDALISITRTGKSIEKGATLYTTTYPCHNCARHIIASGIEKIYYIEPYEKSLAIKLHDDALCHSENSKKVQLVPFQGIAPSRYQVFFSNTSPNKGHDGRIIHTDRDDQLQVDREFVDSYIEQETKIAGVIVEILGEAETAQ